MQRGMGLDARQGRRIGGPAASGPKENEMPDGNIHTSSASTPRDLAGEHAEPRRTRAAPTPLPGGAAPGGVAVRPFSDPVRQHMSTDLVTVTADCALDEVLEVLRTRDVAAIVVVGREGRAVGTLSYVDLLRIARFHTQSAVTPDLLELPSMCAGDLVRPGIVAVSPDATLADIIRLRHDCGVVRVHVLEDDRPIGVVGTRELARALCAAGRPVPVTEVMRTRVTVLDAAAPATSAVNLGAGGDAVVVLDAGALVGVVTQAEVLSARDLPRHAPVTSLISPAVAYLDAATPVASAAVVARTTQARWLVASDRGRICGVLSGPALSDASVGSP